MEELVGKSCILYIPFKGECPAIVKSLFVTMKANKYHKTPAFQKRFSIATLDDQYSFVFNCETVVSRFKDCEMPVFMVG